jgi:sec-independent protein translocase protein TatA
MFGIGLQELIVIFLIVFLLFGAKSLPEIAKGLGQAIKIFKRESKEWKDDAESEAPPSSPAKGREGAQEKSGSSTDRRDWRPSKKSEDQHQ